MKEAAAAPPRIFLLSPPRPTASARAWLLFRPSAQFRLARRLRTPQGAPLGDVFTFLSGLYFRGKLAYARRSRAPPAASPGVCVITPSEGCAAPESGHARRACARCAGWFRSTPARRATAAARARRATARRRGGAAVEVVLLGQHRHRQIRGPAPASSGERLRLPRRLRRPRRHEPRGASCSAARAPAGAALRARRHGRHRRPRAAAVARGRAAMSSARPR